MSIHEDDEIARLMALSDDEILAEARAEGIDTDKLAYEMAAQFKVIAKLVRERDKARELLGRAWVRNAQWSREVRALQADNVRLRGALADIAGDTTELVDGDRLWDTTGRFKHWNDNDFVSAYRAHRMAARAALAGEVTK